MLLLAIDTSGKNGSIALARTDDSGHIEIVDIDPLVGGAFSAQLIPQISEMLSRHVVNKFNIDALAVTSGPGSFTGLRVGLAAVKALAEVLHKPIAAVSLLELCAFVSGAQGKVMAALDAGRGDVYVGEHELPATPRSVAREYLLTASEFLSHAKGWTVVTHDGGLASSASADGLSVTVIPPLTAAGVAHLGWLKIQQGATVTPDELEANYIRRTDAEMLEKIRS
ncbi:MAG: tRNA (adenosine(37)-N6)-threonylcarbamoyltransferase complex dimerization subunit type 1 TsaB [Candidatus Sulfotelmatobacter sp.]|jgi:tRNA threonylcarbamoyladenosine biosynthesis protein TsaB